MQIRLQKISLLSAVISQLAASAAFGQQIAASDDHVDAVVVSAPRPVTPSLNEAQHAAPNLINTITAEDARKLPDISVAESVRRLPGVSLQTEVGEGRYVNIRGIDADLNGVSFDGVRVPPSNVSSPFGGGRGVALDVIPMGLIEAVTVTKSNLPEQDAEALGGAISLLPKVFPRGAERFFEARIGTGYEELRSTTIKDFSLAGGIRFGGSSNTTQTTGLIADRPFSLMLSGSYYEDRRGIDDNEPTFLDDGIHSPLAYASSEQSFYKNHRKRHSIGGELSWQPDRNNQYFLRAFDAGYTETVLKNRINITPDGNPVLANGQFTDGLTANGFNKTLREEKEKVGTTVITFGGKNTWDDEGLDYRIGFTRGAFNKLYDYNSTFNFTPADGTITYDNRGRGNTPRFTVNGTDYTDPANYALSGFQNSTQAIRDRETTAMLNYSTKVRWTGTEDELFKTGVSMRRRHRDTRAQPFSYEGVPALPLTAFSSGGNVNFYDGAYNNGPQITPGVLQNTLAGLQTISDDDALNATLQSQTAREDVRAVYGQYQMKSGRLGIVGGVRVESTRANYAGYSQGVDANGSVFVTPANAARSYTNFFPSVQMRYALSPQDNVRASFSSTIARPGFNQITPSVVVNPSENTVTQGNPGLKPILARSLDLAFEHHVEDEATYSVGIFNKNLSDYIASSVTNQSFPNTGLYAGFVGNARVISYQNVAHAYSRGIELNVEKKLKGLPAPFDGLGLGFNYTYVDSRFEIRPGQFSSLPSTSRHTANADISYERGGLTMQLAGYYVSRNLIAIGGNGTPDVFSDSRFSLDFGSTYALDKQASLYFNVKNLTNTPLKFSEGTTDRTVQRELYGRTIQVGATVHF